MTDWGKIGGRLAKARRAAKLTGRVAAQRVGVTVGYISRLEIGSSKPAIILLFAALATAYGTSTDYLFGLTNDPAPRRVEPPSPQAQAAIDLLLDLPPDQQGYIADLLRSVRDFAAASGR